MYNGYVSTSSQIRLRMVRSIADGIVSFDMDAFVCGTCLPHILVILAHPDIRVRLRIMCLCDSMRCSSVEALRQNRLKLFSLGSRICAGAKNVIYGCSVPLLLAEWEVPSSSDGGQ